MIKYDKATIMPSIPMYHILPPFPMVVSIYQFPMVWFYHHLWKPPYHAIFHHVSSGNCHCQADANASASGKSQRQAVAEARLEVWDVDVDVFENVSSNSHWNRKNNNDEPANLGGTMGVPCFQTNPFKPKMPLVFWVFTISWQFWQKTPQAWSEVFVKLTWVTARGPQDSRCGMEDEHIVMGGNDLVKPNSTAKGWPRS